MKEITDIISTVNSNLEKNNKLATPLLYEEEFFKLMDESDLMLEDHVAFNELKENIRDGEDSDKEIENFKDLAKVFSKRIPQSEIRQFLKDLSYYMAPSILNSTIKEDIYKICTEIARDPQALTNIESVRKLRKVTNQRVFADRELFHEKTSDVHKLILFLDNYFNKIINQHTTTLDTISEIKKELAELELSTSSSKSLQSLQERLYKISTNLEETIANDSCELKTEQKKCNTLHEQIQELQENLSKAEEEKSIDYLTGVLTRRAYSLEVERIENEYNVFDSNYALIFFDIDHFKKVNDTYGHDCGDVVLSTFAKILNKLTRTEDIIVRYGGEEFVALVHYKNMIEVKNYLRRAKNIITNNLFIYKDIKLNIQFSAGVSFRKNYNSYEETIKKADELLYKAKDTGRNKIILDTDEVL